MMLRLFLFVSMLNVFQVLAQEKNGTFSVTNGIKCNKILSVENRVEIESKGKYRIIKTNAIPNHKVGKFPNSGNPNYISEQRKEYKILLNPKKQENLTSVYSDGYGQGFPAYEFGVALNGVKLEPTAAEFFGGRSSKTNTDWVLEALSTNVNLGDDCNNAHVQRTGEYHYHGTPWEYIKKLPRNKMQQIGWAADGFPIYYKYGFEKALDPDSKIIELTSSYQLKHGKRPGNGKTSPNGAYDGTYVKDFEFIDGLGHLDKANGRYGVTPEFPEGTYYYVITDDFPSIPRYFVGKPSNDFAVGGGMMLNGGRRMAGNRFQRNQVPNSQQLMKLMDSNNDGMLSRNEVKGPLLRDFSKVDTNNDGFISKKELEKAPKPKN